MHTSEHAEQAVVIEWCFLNLSKYPELDLIHSIPNGAMLGGGKIGAMRMNVLKKEGLRPGTPDLFLPSAHGGKFGAYIEMKTEKGRLSENQSQFISQVEKYGYICFVAYGAQEAIEFLEDYLNQPYTTTGYVIKVVEPP